MELVALDRAYKVDEEISTDDKSIVIVRFGRGSKKSDGDENNDIIQQVDECLQSLNPVDGVPIKVFTVDMKAVPELVARYKLGDPVTVLFFHKNIQGGRLQGRSIRKDEITRTVFDLATKKRKPREPTKISTTSNTAIHRNIISKQTETSRPRFSFRLWW